MVEEADNGLGKLKVGWDGGDKTEWTRAGPYGEFDVCLERNFKRQAPTLEVQTKSR